MKKERPLVCFTLNPSRMNGWEKVGESATHNMFALGTWLGPKGVGMQVIAQVWREYPALTGGKGDMWVKFVDLAQEVDGQDNLGGTLVGEKPDGTYGFFVSVKSLTEVALPEAFYA